MYEYLLELANKLFNELTKQGVEEAEFYGSWSRDIILEIANNKVKTITTRETGEYGIRGSIGKRVAGIASSNLNPDPREIAERLTSIIKSSPEDKDWRGFAKNYSRGVLAKTFDKRIDEISIEEVLELVKHYMNTSIEAAKKKGAEETVIAEGMIHLGTGGVVVANSDGEHLYSEHTGLGLFYIVKSRKNDEESSFTVFHIDRRLDEERLEREAKRGGEYSVLFINAKPVESGTYKLLLDQYNVAKFIDTVLEPAFSALNVQEGRSPLRNKLGSKILYEGLSIIDDPSIDWGVNSRSFDDEGIPTTRKYIVRNGVLETYLYNYYTAGREGKRSTGNGFRRSPASPTTPRATNLVFQSDKAWSWDELVAEIDRGLIIHDMIGYWMSNPVNGAVQATITHGLLVEKGEIKHPVKGVVIGGNIYEWLGENLVATGKELLNVGSLYVMPLLIDKVSVAGK